MIPQDENKSGLLGRLPFKITGIPFWVWAVLPGLVAFWVYLPVLDNSFVNWDDPAVILNNLPIRNLSLHSAGWLFTHFLAGFYTPWTWLSLALDRKMGGPDPWIFHLHNLILHVLNTTLVFFVGWKVLNRAGGASAGPGRGSWEVPAAFLAALWFGIHPLHVEPVAWATGRKDLLCAFFSFSCLYVYLGNPSQPARKNWEWITCTVLLILALLTKPVAVVLPFVFLLLDWWPLRRWGREGWRLFFEKIPFFLLAISAGWLAVAAERQAGAVASLGFIPTGFRVMNSLYSPIFYLWKTAAPFGLSVLYSIHLKRAFSPEHLGAAAVFLLVSLFCWFRRKQQPYWLAAWIFYILGLGPSLGIVAVGGQAAADRYAYLPGLAPFLVLAAVLTYWLRSRWRVLSLLTLALSIFFAIVAVRQIHVWHDSVALWESTLKNYPDSSPAAFTCLADACWEEGKTDEALYLFDLATKMGTPLSEAHNGKGKIFMERGLGDAAAREFEAALLINPEDGWALSYLDVIHSQEGMKEMALAERKRALEAQPDNAWAHFQDGLVYGKFGFYNQAETQVEKAVQLEPSFPEAFFFLGQMYRAKADARGSLMAFEKAHALEPGNIDYLNILADSDLRFGKPAEALVFYRELQGF